jgi:hypothetical protein
MKPAWVQNARRLRGDAKEPALESDSATFCNCKRGARRNVEMAMSRDGVELPRYRRAAVEHVYARHRMARLSLLVARLVPVYVTSFARVG